MKLEKKRENWEEKINPYDVTRILNILKIQQEIFDKTIV